MTALSPVLVSYPLTIRIRIFPRETTSSITYVPKLGKAHTYCCTPCS
jgi:hypothetical protein